jgi:hypothetical protein
LAWLPGVSVEVNGYSLELWQDRALKAVFDLSDITKTVLDVTDWLGEKVGDTTLLEKGLGSRPAIILFQTQGLDNDNFVLLARTSLTWSLLESISVARESAKTAIVAMLNEIRIDQAEGYWLDQHGVIYGVKRHLNEMDADYFQRLKATIFRQKGNNVAMEIALASDENILVTVADDPAPGVFNVSVPYGWDDGGMVEKTTQITSFVNQFKAGGTQLGMLQFSPSEATDSVNSEQWEDEVSLFIGNVARYNGNYRHDGTIQYQGNLKEVVLV